MTAAIIIALCGAYGYTLLVVWQQRRELRELYRPLNPAERFALQQQLFEQLEPFVAITDETDGAQFVAIEDAVKIAMRNKE